MKKRFAILALLAASAASVHAEKLPQWLRVLPGNTLGYVAVRNAPELMEDWQKSGYGRLIADPEFRKWIAPLYKEGDAAWDKALKEATGDGLEANLRRIQGSVLLAIAADSAEAFEDVDNNNPFIILMEAGDQQAKLQELIEKEVEEDLVEHKEWRKLTKDVDGVPLNVLAVSEEPDARWNQAYAFVGDVLVIGDKPALLEYFIPALKNGTGDAAGTVAGHLERHSRLMDGLPDISVYANGEVLMQWLEKGLAESHSKREEQKLPVDPKMILEALGTREIQSLGIGIEMGDAQSRLDIALLHSEKPRGILTLFQGSSTDVAPPAFVPENVLSGQVARQSLSDIYGSLLAMVGRLGPMAAMATMQIGMVEQQMGFKLKEDLFGSLADEVVTISDGSAASQSQVYGIKVKDRARLAGVLDGLKRFVGQGFGAAFEEGEYLGSSIFTYKMSQAGATPTASNELAYCLTDDYLFFSSGTQDALRKLLARMKEPAGGSLWDSPRTQELIAALPKGYFGLGVSDASKQFFMAIDALNTVQKQAAAKKKAPAAKKGPGKGPKKAGPAEVTEDGPDSWFDPAARPSDELIKKYLGTEVGGNYNHPDAVHFRMLSKPVQ
ncbi:MAG: hypothetical protein CJBNEKGG_02366 [Prosthecobacter sp.]|nr:hypothetical protein [Prosthecobacter sp.]